MSEEETFECRKCGKRAVAASPPECCGELMKPLMLEPCSRAFGPEDSRPTEDEGPCDDSRGG